MADYEHADSRLMEWLAERTDEQLQRLLDAPEDGLTNSWYTPEEGPDGVCRGCLHGWTRGGTTREATGILGMYGIHPIYSAERAHAEDNREVMRRIQGFAAAELLTRRVERPKLPAPVEVMSADPLNSGYREGA